MQERIGAMEKKLAAVTFRPEKLIIKHFSLFRHKYKHHSFLQLPLIISTHLLKKHNLF